MNQSLRKRLDAIESDISPDIGDWAFLCQWEGGYVITHTGQFIPEDELATLNERYPNTHFILPSTREYPEAPDVTPDDMMYLNKARHKARSEGREYCPETDPDPRVRAIEAELKAHQELIDERTPTLEDYKRLSEIFGRPDIL